MSKRTKKVGNTGWMGPRYGIRIRRKVLDLDRARELNGACPRCSTVTVVRLSSGVYQCKRCETKFTSGAYLFSAPPPFTRAEREEPAAPPGPKS